jgi:hypothetical protein
MRKRHRNRLRNAEDDESHHQEERRVLRDDILGRQEENVEAPEQEEREEREDERPEKLDEYVRVEQRQTQVAEQAPGRRACSGNGRHAPNLC